MKHLHDAIAAFLAAQRVERGLAPSTLEAYESDLLQAAAALAEGDDRPVRLASITALDLKDFLADLRDIRRLEPKSLARRVSSLRAFFRFCVDRQWLKDSPARGLRTPKLPRKLPIHLTADEARQLLSAVDPDNPMALRDAALLALFLYGGLRLAELAGLRRSQIDFAAGTIRVLGKGSKERIAPLHPNAADRLERHLKDACVNADAPVFPREDGAPLTTRQAGYIVHKAVRRAGLSHRITPHKLRHTFATQLLQEGADLMEIRDLLGHSNLATTAIYTHTNVERLRKAVDLLED